MGYGGVGDVWKSKKGEKGVGVERGWGGGGVEGRGGGKG